MDTRIEKLPDSLANQIAAGEVVERPASVVKELIENAIDAQATRITVETEGGGTQRIRVTDDGFGMSPADAERSIERHATSKIRAFDDLLRLTSFGFRGEALPSIASVSRLTISTRRKSDAQGTQLVVAAGGATSTSPVGASPGTRIDVEDLFYNVPARRKFLKSEATENAHVSETVLMAALARPDIAFELIRDGKRSREFLRTKTRAERVAQVMGDDSLVRCQSERGPMSIEAYLSAPERARAGAGSLHLFVNGRPVRDRLLLRAVAQGYGSVLEGGRYPVGVVYIDVPPEEVDVNVHPQKTEVRFVEARAVFDALSRGLRDELAKSFALPALNREPQQWNRAGSSSLPASRDGTREQWPARERHVRPLPGGAASGIDAVAPPGAAAPAYAAAEPPSSHAPLLGEQRFYAALRFLAQVQSTYLLCEGEDGLYVLDQHAAAERVTFERLRRGYASRTIASQRLLIAETVSARPDDIALITEHAESILTLGIDVRPAGPSAVAVHAIPRVLTRIAPARLVGDLLAELSRDATRPFSGAVDLVLATMACHGSIRGGDAVSREEATSLLASLDDVDFAGHCPHGRPIITRIAFSELERRVGR